jgi:hypothetical protein
MKKLDPVVFDYALGRQQVTEFRNLLASKAELAESADILPFFRQRPHLSVLLGMYNARIGWADRLAYEFDIFGDFACDLAIGEWGTGSYCFIEFEDAYANSIFEKQGKKAARAWARRFDQGFSQIVDWLHKLDDRAGYDFVSRFGRHTINYETVLVIGRDQHLDDGEKLRLEWRSSSIVVNSKRVHCITFDQLLSQLSTRLGSFAAVAPPPPAATGTPLSGPASPPPAAPPPGGAPKPA